MEQPQKTNTDAANGIIELDDDSLEQINIAGGGLRSIHLPFIHKKVGVRYETKLGVRAKYPVYQNRLTGNEHVQYPDGTKKYDLNPT